MAKSLSNDLRARLVAAVEGVATFWGSGFDSDQMG